MLSVTFQYCIETYKLSGSKYGLPATATWPNYAHSDVTQVKYSRGSDARRDTKFELESQSVDSWPVAPDQQSVVVLHAQNKYLACLGALGRLHVCCQAHQSFYITCTASNHHHHHHRRRRRRHRRRR